MLSETQSRESWRQCQDQPNNYNYFRDYDPAVGRYVESDPIGLVGGPNTYAYVMNMPSMFIDPRGQLLAPVVWGIRVGWGIYQAYRTAQAVAPAAVALGLAAAATDPSQEIPDAANEPSFGGEDCPPDCRRLREILNAFYQAMERARAVKAHSPEYIDLLEERFWQFVRNYEKICGPYTPPPSLEEIYTR